MSCSEGAPVTLEGWSAARIDAECKEAYEAYTNAVRARHIEYFAERPAERSLSHPFAANSRPLCFPPGCEGLAEVLAEQSWHRHHLSGASSQVLTVALLSSAMSADPSLGWLPNCGMSCPLGLFEVQLAAHVLEEHPRQTSLDWLVLDRSGVIAGEAKFTERGFGCCSCQGRHAGRCALRVLMRPYWDVAASELGLTRKESSGVCGLGLVFQPVRNIAAAQAIASGERTTTFFTLYDERNPYFTGSRQWPGWIIMLSSLMRNATTAFAALSWQELVERVEFDEPVRRWATDKHGLFKERQR